ncbi:metal-dependent transcriptional regulator [Candidatus Poribacteria bacterium]|nr:metal-dependent transcriptional regulator [Candidatus Poribacteria bacterium]
MMPVDRRTALVGTSWETVMQTWKEFDENTVTHSMAHYLMAIQDLLGRQGYARVTDVARELEITPGSASVSIKALKAKGFVSEDHNRFLGLTPEGERTAHEIHVANRSFIHLLVDIFGVSEEQAEIDSCKIEHLVSPQTREKVLAFLHFATSDTPVAKDFIRQLKAHRFECPGPENCEFCETESCTLDCIHHEHKPDKRG